MKRVFIVAVSVLLSLGMMCCSPKSTESVISINITDGNLKEQPVLYFPDGEQIAVELSDSGTGSAAAVSGITVAGKTGTAENATGNDHSWFIGFAPAEDPKVAVAVLIENSNYGSATPIAGRVIRAALSELGVY